ncbi:unnamed protein product [Boreogadus saida]
MTRYTRKTQRNFPYEKLRPNRLGSVKRKTKTSRPLAPNRTTQSDYGTHFGLRRDVFTLPWSFRKTSRPLATNHHTQSDYGTHFGLRRDVVPLLWSSRKTSRPLATNPHIQSDYVASSPKWVP